MDSGWWWWCLWWCCHAADAALRCVGAAFVAHRWLAPWTWWTLRRGLCWTRWALHSLGGMTGAGSGTATLRQPSACECCGGVDFDGMVGRWAVVTGCTDGIGKEYALQLAARGMNVALVSRNRVKLQAVAEEINARHGDTVRTRIVVADFTSRRGTASLTETYDGVRRGLDGLDVALLMNNAGTCYARPDRLLDLPPCCSSCPSADGGDPIRDVIECNALATVAMCRIVMPLMAADAGPRRRAERCGRPIDEYADEDGDGESLLLSTSPPPSPEPPAPFTEGGVVVNISSASALVPCPLLSVYGATKAFVHKFSMELAAEYADQRVGGRTAAAGRRWRPPPRIDVRCLNTGFVATKMSRMRSATVGLTWIPGPGLYARHSLRSLACHCGCRMRRDRERARESGGRAAGGEGGGLAEWLAGAASAVLDAPSSPFSVGRSEITTTGFVTHTFMVYLLNAAKLLFGEAFVSKNVCLMMAHGRDRMAKRDEEKMRDEFAAEERRKDGPPDDRTTEDSAAR